MERERPDDEDKAERETVKRAEAVYGDTDMNPNADDQKDAHHAKPDEHV